MPLAGEQVQHAPGVGGVQRFAQYFALDDYRGVCAQDDLAIDRKVGGGRVGFLARDAHHVIAGRLVGERRFVHVHGPDNEGNAGLP